MKVAVIGGGVGGLAAATRLAILGHRVQLFEARDEVGGLASGLDRGGLSFDGGPYILLDRPGLEWAFERLGLDVSALQLIRVEDLYEVRSETSEAAVRVFFDLQHTAEQLEQRWPGAGESYIDFVNEMEAIRSRLEPMLRISHPSLSELARRGSLAVAPFLLRSLSGVLGRSGLPGEVASAIAIWTHVAGQSLEKAPSVMALIPALIHRVGAFVPAGGMRAVPRLLAANALEHGVEIHTRTSVRKVRTTEGRVTGVELAREERVDCDAVVSNYHGVGTYDGLVEVPERVRRRLRALPLQSPGLCAYLSARGELPGPYLRFRLDHHGVRLRVSSLLPGARVAVRLIMPMDHGEAMKAGEESQSAELKRMLAESWWRDGLSEVELVDSRTVRGWGREMNLYRDSMNPAMTKTLMLRGRIAHRSPWVRGLYLAGASTHPGQWVSFCAISGVLAAESLHADGKAK